MPRALAGRPARAARAARGVSPARAGGILVRGGAGSHRRSVQHDVRLAAAGGLGVDQRGVCPASCQQLLVCSGLGWVPG